MKKTLILLGMVLALCASGKALASIDLAATPNQLSTAQQTAIRNNLNGQVNLGVTIPTPGIFAWPNFTGAPTLPSDSFGFDPSGNFNVPAGLNVPGPMAVGSNTLTANSLAQLTAAANFAGTVYLTAPVTLTANLTTTCDLSPAQGAIITTNGYTLELNGSFEAGNYQCFAGTGTVTFGANSASQIVPQWFGTKGDGVTDDTQAIKNWVSALSKSSTPGSGHAGYVPAGVYMFSSPITIPECVIRGAGEYTTVFRASSAGAQILFTFSLSPDDSRGSNGDYSNFTIDGNNLTTGPLVQFSLQNYARITSVAFINGGNGGVELSGTQNSLFSECVFSGNGGASVLFDNVMFAGSPLGASGNIFLRCEIIGYATYGIESIELSTNNEFLDGIVEAANPNGNPQAAVLINDTYGPTPALTIRGGWVDAETNSGPALSFPTFDCVSGVLTFEGASVSNNTTGNKGSIFYLESSGSGYTSVYVSGVCNFVTPTGTYLFFEHNIGLVYDTGNYFVPPAQIFGTDVGASWPNVVSSPLNANIVARSGIQNGCAGTATLSSGAATVTMPEGNYNSSCLSGRPVICTDQTAAEPVKCTPGIGTLAITGTGSDVISWAQQ